MSSFAPKLRSPKAMQPVIVSTDSIAAGQVLVPVLPHFGLRYPYHNYANRPVHIR
jgi:hypothetical protein